MKHLMHAMLAVLAVAGCPQAPPEPIASIDGLEGGSLSTDVTVPTLVATAVRAGDVTTTTLASGDATITSLTTESATIATLAAATITADAASVEGAFSAESIEVVDLTAVAVAADIVRARSLRLASTSQPLDDGSLLGVVVGATAVDGNGGYPGLNSVCNVAFNESHVCGELEILHFLRSINFSIHVQSLGLASIDGASYATTTKQVIGFDALNEPIIADDCESWLGVQNAGALPGGHARHVLDIESIGGSVFFGRVDTSNLCSLDDLRVLCCGQ